MPALLPAGDESAMNFEGLGVSKACRIGPGLCGTSENAQKAKLAEFHFYEVGGTGVVVGVLCIG